MIVQRLAKPLGSMERHFAELGGLARASGKTHRVRVNTAIGELDAERLLVERPRTFDFTNGELTVEFRGVRGLALDQQIIALVTQDDDIRATVASARCEDDLI